MSSDKTNNRSSFIGFIGAGNMASAILHGLVSNGWPTHALGVSDTDQAKCASLSADLDIQSLNSNQALAANADIVVLAVKPQVMQAVCLELATALANEQSPLILSIAAGVPVASLRQWLNPDCAIVRVMPNTPALVGAGTSALYANPKVTSEQRGLAGKIMSAVGTTLWLDDEDLLDAVTALSGSGPAYFFHLIEIMVQAGCEMGLKHDDALKLCTQTAYGAAVMANAPTADLKALRTMVTSPGGTTERALSVLDEGGLTTLVHKALKAARDRSRELADVPGDGS
ncbi:MAG: pyrroline-5-carboxylate reductase [Gammaproteobacteria bacterium]|nr:MAG: pyrroline-5-carboxylate reductase [Gammaproteobacteria bacterium]